MVLAAVLCVLCVLWIIRRYVKFRQPSLHPGGIIGNTYFMGFKSESLWKKVKQLSDECIRFGGLTRFLPIIQTFYLTTDPEVMRSVLNTSLRKGHFQKFWKPWLGDGIVNAPVPLWKAHRKLLNPVYCQRILDDYLVIFNAQAKRLAQTWMEYTGKTIDPLPSLAVTNLDTICLTTFGFSEDQDTLSEYSKAVNDLNWITAYRFERFWYHNDLLFKFSRMNERQERNLKIVHDMSAKLINKRKSVLNKMKDIKNGASANLSEANKLFVDMLLEFESEGLYTEKQVREEVDTFLFGGHDSVSVTTAFTLVLLGSYPSIQDRLYKEIQDQLGSGDVGKKDLSKLVYLEAVIKESMRLYPYAPYFSRSIDEDIQLKNYTLSAGSVFFGLVYGTHRDPALWGTDADQFRPERWLDHSVPEHPVAFAGFSWGKRGCIGKPYAMMLMKTTLCYLVRTFKFKADFTKLKLEMNTVLKPRNGHHLTFTIRC